MVAEGRLFTQEQRGEVEAVVCYDADTGTPIWAHESEARFWEAMGGVGPRATPTYADGRLFSLGATGLLHCLNPITGKVVWRAEVDEDPDRALPTWGLSSSPLVLDGVVIVHAGASSDPGMLGFDAQTGELRWTMATAGNETYSSPHAAKICGRQCVLMLTNHGLTIVDPSTGRLLCEYEFKFRGYRVAQPWVVNDTSILLGTPRGIDTRRT